MCRSIGICRSICHVYVYVYVQIHMCMDACGILLYFLHAHTQTQRYREAALTAAAHPSGLGRLDEGIRSLQMNAQPWLQDGPQRRPRRASRPLDAASSFRLRQGHHHGEQAQAVLMVSHGLPWSPLLWMLWQRCFIEGALGPPAPWQPPPPPVQRCHPPLLQMLRQYGSVRNLQDQREEWSLRPKINHPAEELDPAGGTSLVPMGSESRSHMT